MLKKLAYTGLLLGGLLQAEFIRDDNLEVVTDTTIGLMWEDSSHIADTYMEW